MTSGQPVKVRAASATDAISEVTSELSHYIGTALARPLPVEVGDKAKHHILDTFAALVTGARLKAGKLAIGYVRSLGGRREATVAGARFLTTAVNAALANGMSGHADETDDSHLGGRFHPGCGIAIAEKHGASGTDLLRAVVLGYDIGSRVNLAMGLHRPNDGTHSTHSTGPLFGGVAAAAALMKFDARQVRHALSYAVQQASGMPYWHRDHEHVEKAFDFGGMGARNAVAAATMVGAGFSGVDDPFSGPANFFTMFGDAPSPGTLVEGLGTRFEIMAASIKKWCVGSPIQAAVDAVEVLIRDHRLRADEVEGMTVHMPDDRMHIVDNRPMPDVCVQHILAITLIDGGLSFASAHDYARMTDPAVQALRARTELVGSAELTRAVPARQAIVEIVTRDGRKLRERTRAVRGTPDNPMDRAEIETKSLDLLAPILGTERTRELIERVWRIETVASVLEFRPYLQS